MKPILNLLILICLLTACSSKKHFTSRKYTNGRYVSYAKHKQKVSKHTGNNNEIASSAKSEIQAKTVVIEPQAVTPETKTKPVSVAQAHQTREEQKALNVIKGGKTYLGRPSLASALNRQIEKQEKSKLLFDESEGTTNKSLISVFLSAGSILAAIAAFIVAIATVEYIFLVISALALVLSIVGLIMGIMGMRQYKKEKENGNRKTSSLVLGIVGTSLGGVGIFVSLYFALIGALIVSEW